MPETHSSMPPDEAPSSLSSGPAHSDKDSGLGARICNLFLGGGAVAGPLATTVYILVVRGNGR